MMDAVTRYDVDGVHFDDYFYPYPVSGADHPRRGHVRPVRRRLRQHRRLAARQRRPAGAELGPAHPRGQAVRSSSASARSASGATPPPTRSARRPPGCSPTTRSTPTPARWVKQGWIDYIAPQIYWHIGFAVADYATLVRLVGRRGAPAPTSSCYVGQAAYRAGATGQAAAWQTTGRADRPPPLQPRPPAGARRHLLQRQGRPGRPDRRDHPGGRRPLQQARAGPARRLGGRPPAAPAHHRRDPAPAAGSRSPGNAAAPAPGVRRSTGSTAPAPPTRAPSPTPATCSARPRRAAPDLHRRHRHGHRRPTPTT